MKLYFKEKGILFLTFVFLYLLIEYVTFAWVDFSFLPQSFIIDLIFLMGMGLIGLLFRSNKLTIIYYTLILSWIMALFLINATMYSVYFELFTLQQLTLLGEATSVFSFEFLSISSIIIAAIIAFLYFLSITLLWRKFYRNSRQIPNYYRKTFMILGGVAFSILLILSVGFTTIKRFNSTTYITTFKRASLEEYGLLAYYWKEFKVVTFSSFTGNNSGEEEVLIPNDPSSPSEYFGLLEDANVITILVESLQPFAVSEVLTPNLYRMTQEGLYFPNNYSENKTNVSEIISIAGNYPTFYFLPNSFDYDFSHSLPSILSKTYDYKTAYFHDNVGSFYGRDKLFMPLGFEELYFHDDLFPQEKIWTWNGDYTLDSVTIEKILDEMQFTEEPFYYYWATMSSHGPYNYGPGNIELFTDLGYFEAIDEAVVNGDWVNPLENGEEIDRLRLRHYEAAIMDFDRALGRLLEELENSGEIDNTILVFFGDHNIYYHDLHLKINDVDSSMYYDMELYQAFLAVYNPVLTDSFVEDNGTNEIEKFVSPHNIVPTLYDLLGIGYNQNLMMGESVFLDSSNVFYSHKLTGFFDNQLFSDDGYEIIYSKNEIEQDYIDSFVAISQELRERLEIINYWYDNTKQSH